MQAGWRVGSLFGIPLLIDPSWFWIVALFTFRYGNLWQREGWGTNIAWVAGFLMAMLLFASVLLHELGHSLVARSQGIQVSSITLFLFGGIASIDQESKNPAEAFWVAISGPAVSFGLFVLLSGVQQGLPLAPPVAAVITNLAGINLVLAIFNMLPGLPLDGGQVLKAAIWKVTGSRLQGVRWAATAGQLLGWVAIVGSVLLYFASFNLFVLWIGLIGWFGVRNATVYRRVTELQQALLSLDAAAAMTLDYRVVDATLTLHQFMDKYLLLEEVQTPAFYAVSDGRYRGLVSLEELRLRDRSVWDSETVLQIVHPLTDIATVKEGTPLSEVVNLLETQELRRITVLSPAEAVAGVIDRGDVVRAIAEKLKIPMPDTLIKRIKEEGTYPLSLPLQTIAKSLEEEPPLKSVG